MRDALYEKVQGAVVFVGYQRKTKLSTHLMTSWTPLKRKIAQMLSAQHPNMVWELADPKQALWSR